MTIDTRANRIAPAADFQRQRVSMLRRDAWLVLALVTAVVGLVTLGKPFIEIPGLIEGAAHRTRSLDLHLFNGFDHPPVWYGPWTNTFGNIALFFPLGAVLVVLGQVGKYARFGVGFTVAALMAVSVGIEATQYIFRLGFSDIDDVVCNTIGAALGVILLARTDHEAQAKIVQRLGFLAAAALCVLFAGLLWGLRDGLMA